MEKPPAVNDSPAESAPEPNEPAFPNVRRIVFAVIGAIVLVAVAYIGIRHLQFTLAHEETDDAQVEGDIGPVLPRVSGYVTRVLVQDNQRVDAGRALIEIDHRELDLKVAETVAAWESARAMLANAQAAIASAQAAEQVARANIATAAVIEAKTASDLARDTNLFDTHAITDRQLTDTRAAHDEAAARLVAERRQADATDAQVRVAEAQVGVAQAQIAQRQADLDYARLERSYATVVAPIAGIVSHKDVEPGQFVQAGQTLLSVASDNLPRVIANFKETQLAHMRPGQPAEFTVDSFPGVEFSGRVDSLAGATGARFALLPPDNATGNFVKVTQRVPVKIMLTGAPDPRHVLRPGMSVDVAVRVKD